MKKITGRVALVTAGFAVSISLLVGWLVTGSGSEPHGFYSPSVGMTKDEVLILLGEPLIKQSLPKSYGSSFPALKSVEQWLFVGDDKCICVNFDEEDKVCVSEILNERQSNTTSDVIGASRAETSR